MEHINPDWKKLELISKIREFHPAYEPGLRRGWSWYVGGMRDSGDWYWSTLMRATEEELQECLNELEAIKNTPEPTYTDEEKEDMKQIVQVAPGIWSNMYQIKLQRKLFQEFENTMLWGSKKNA